jgi:hypothetical protein
MEDVKCEGRLETKKKFLNRWCSGYFSQLHHAAVEDRRCSPLRECFASCTPEFDTLVCFCSVEWFWIETTLLLSECSFTRTACSDK